MDGSSGYGRMGCSHTHLIEGVNNIAGGINTRFRGLLMLVHPQLLKVVLANSKALHNLNGGVATNHRIQGIEEIGCAAIR